MYSIPGNVLIIDDNANITIEKGSINVIEKAKELIGDLKATPYHKRGSTNVVLSLLEESINSSSSINASDSQYFKNVDNYFMRKGIPTIRFTNISDDTENVINQIKKLDNVRIIMLDLDLDDCGDISDFDREIVRLVIETAFEKFGYFFLIIQSNHSEEWQSIKDEIINDVPELKDKLENMSFCINKSDDFRTIYTKICKKNTSLKVLGKFEKELNVAKDCTFSNFVEFNSNTWGQLFSTIRKEPNNLGDSEVNNIFMSNLKQHMINIDYGIGSSMETADPMMLSHIFKALNYCPNNNGILENQPVWTGNVYQTGYSHDGMKYAVVVTPECDIAQNQYDVHKIIYGIEVNNDTLHNRHNMPNPGEEKESAPLVVTRLSTGKKNYKKFKTINDDFLNVNKNPQHFYILPFCGIEEQHVLLDFRYSTFVTDERFNSWKLIGRVNDPMIVSILDKFSSIYNRKGQMVFDFKGQTLI